MPKANLKEDPQSAKVDFLSACLSFCPSKRNYRLVLSTNLYDSLLASPFSCARTPLLIAIARAF